MNRVVLFISILLFAVSSFAQTKEDMNSILSYLVRATNFNRVMPQEKVYLHFDNTGYFEGETIWFKAYVVRTDSAKLTDMSAVLYVELVSPSGDVVEKRKLQIKDGMAHGEIKLDKILRSGFYEVRAYTRYMTNWGSSGVFSRVFPVFDKPKTEGDYSHMQLHTENKDRVSKGMRELLTDDKEDDVCIRLYPEGGNLLRGVPNRVAFTVKTKDGIHVDAAGTLLDNKGNAVCDVLTSWEGKGVFSFVPDDSPYKLVLTDVQGKTIKAQLPMAAKEGMALQLGVKGDSELLANVYASEALKGKLVGYVITHNGNIVFADTVYASASMILPFSREILPDGVSQLTLFTADGHIQAERQFFICPKADTNDSIRIIPQQAFPQPCGKVKAEVLATPHSHLSLAVLDMKAMVNGTNGNAKTWLLLESDVKGYIEHPDYYFESDDDAHRDNADLLMMTQGWRRYDWAMMAGLRKDDTHESQHNSFFTQPLEDNLNVYGKVHPRRKKDSHEGVKVSMTFYNKTGQHMSGETLTDKDGKYLFFMPDVNGEWNLIISTDKGGKSMDCNVSIDRHFSPEIRTISPYEKMSKRLPTANFFNTEETKLAIATDTQLVVGKRDRLLSTVTVKAKRENSHEESRRAWETEKTAEHYAYLFYNADEDADKLADMGKAEISMLDWLKWRNPKFGGNDVTYHDFGRNLIDETTKKSPLINFDLIKHMHRERIDIFNITQGPPGFFIEVDDTWRDEIPQVYEQLDTYWNPRITSQGINYEGRPVVWIINNQYAGLTNISNPISFWRNVLVGGDATWNVMRPTSEFFPASISDIKSAYVTDEPMAYKNYITSTILDQLTPVTVFLYTHPYSNTAEKGIRHTHFQGFNIPETFKTEDYTNLPPMEDFRRTLYWAPDVTTDSTGHATIEFWNNSSCKEMFISAEEVTKDGRFVVYE